MHTYAARALCWALACLFSSTVGAQKPGPQEAPVVRYAPGQPMPDRYIVTLAKGVADVPAEAEAVMRGRGGRIHQHFKNSFKGFAATIPASELDSVRNNPKVLAVERDQILRLNEAGSPEQQTSWGTEPIAPQSKAADSNFARQPGTGVGSVVPRTSIAPKVPASAPVPSAQKLSTLEAKSAPQEIASFRFPAPKPIADRYIVTLSKDVVDTQAESESLMRGRGGRVHQHFKHGFRGFTATIPASELERVRRLPHVLAVEPDQMVQINQAVSVVPQATWSLDRIDQVDRPLDSQYSFKNTGAGVTAFIVDTGIRADHSEFGGRVLPGFSVVTDGNGTSDCNGHGTHVAGVVGGRTGRSQGGEVSSSAGDGLRGLGFGKRCDCRIGLGRKHWHPPCGGQSVAGWGHLGSAQCGGCRCSGQRFGSGGRRWQQRHRRLLCLARERTDGHHRRRNQ